VVRQSSSRLRSAIASRQSTLPDHDTAVQIATRQTQCIHFARLSDCPSKLRTQTLVHQFSEVPDAPANAIHPEDYRAARWEHRPSHVLASLVLLPSVWAPHRGTNSTAGNLKH